MIWNKQTIINILTVSQTEAGAEQKTGNHQNRYLVYRMLQALYERQTSDEKAVEGTRHTNGRGFTHGDAPKLTRIAKQSQQYKNLTAKQVAKIVAPRLLKYAGQIEAVIKENGKYTAPVKPAPASVVTASMKKEAFSNEEWAGYKNQFAQLEKQQEEFAFMAGMREAF